MSAVPGSGPRDGEPDLTGPSAPVSTGAGAEGATLAAAVIGGVLLVVADVRDRVGLGLLGIAFLAAACWMAWFTAIRRYGWVTAGVSAILAVGLFSWLSGSVVSLAVPLLGAAVGLAVPGHRGLRLGTVLALTTLVRVALARS